MKWYSSIWIAVAILAAALLLAGCSGQSATGTATASPATPFAGSPTAPPSPLAGTAVPSAQASLAAAATPPAGTYLNPVFNRDFPDPDTLKVGGTYYAYATNSSSINIQVASSPDLVSWKLVGNALPRLPAWAAQDFGWAWAPEVTTDASGNTFLMYFTARFKRGQGGTQCIGLATGQKPEGPFLPVGEKPMICQVDQGGSIDASSFVNEDGKRYLLWKNDGNSGGGQTWIYIQEISPDGLTLLGEATKLITADQAWEGVLVEGPTLWKHEGKYYLFYSANDFASRRYAVGWAVADTPLGPYQKGVKPLLATDLKAGIVGPGGQDVVVDESGRTWLLFHSWTPGSYRALDLARLEWDGDTPVVTGLSREPAPGPQNK